MNAFKENKKIFIALFIFLVLLGWVAFLKLREDKIISREFGGQIIKIENNTIFLKGLFNIEKGGEFIKKQAEREVRVLLIPDIKLVKTLLYLPEATGLEPVKYNPNDLKKDYQEGSLEDLKENTSGITVTSDRNIFNKSKFKAVKIEYIEPVFP